MRKVVVLAIALLVPLGACAGGDGDASDPESGPLQASIDLADQITVKAPTDKLCHASMGAGFTNRTDERIRIVDVRPQVLDEAEFLGIMTQPKNDGGVGGVPGFPPKMVRKYGDEIHDFIGTVIEPGESADYFIGIKPESKGYGTVGNLIYTYEVDDDELFAAVDNDTFQARCLYREDA